MPNRSIIALLVLIISTLTFQDAIAGSSSQLWRIDPAASRVTFSVMKLPATRVDGVFTGFEGWIRYDASRPDRSAIHWRVRVASLKTDEPNRDSTLQGSEYFGASSHPEISFTSTAVQRLTDGSLRVTGRMNIRGVSREVVVRAVPHRGADGRFGFSCEFTLDRFDYGVIGGRVTRAAVARVVTIRLRAVLAPSRF